jgi:hypothetical protein
MKTIAKIPGDKINSPITFSEDGNLYIIGQDSEFIIMNMRQLDSLGAAIERYFKRYLKLEQIKNAN